MLFSSSRRTVCTPCCRFWEKLKFHLFHQTFCPHSLRAFRSRCTLQNSWPHFVTALIHHRPTTGWWLSNWNRWIIFFCKKHTHLFVPFNFKPITVAGVGERESMANIEHLAQSGASARLSEVGRYLTIEKFPVPSRQIFLPLRKRVRDGQIVEDDLWTTCSASPTGTRSRSIVLSAPIDESDRFQIAHQTVSQSNKSCIRWVVCHSMYPCILGIIPNFQN